MSESDVIRAFVERRLAELGLDMKGVSQRLEKNPAYIQQYLRRRTPEWLPDDVAEKLAGLLGCPIYRLMPRPLAVPPTEASTVRTDSILDAPRGRAAQSEVRPAGPVRLEQGERDFPVMGTTKGGDGGGFEINNGEPIEYRRRPAGLAGTSRAFGLYVQGDSAYPKFAHGKLIIVHPDKPAAIGDWVVVEMFPEVDGDNPAAYLKQLVKRQGDAIVVEQLNPPKRITIKNNQIKRILRVLDIDDIVGP